MNATLAGVMTELQILIMRTEDKVRSSKDCRGCPTKIMINIYIYK